MVILQAFEFPERQLNSSLRTMPKPRKKRLLLIRGMLRGSLLKITQRLFQAALFVFREQPILQLRDALKNSQEHLDSTVAVRQQRHGPGRICYFGPNLDRHESSVVHHSERRLPKKFDEDIVSHATLIAGALCARIEGDGEGS